MWGNRLGWTISAAIVVMAAGVLWLIANSSRRTAPTAFSRDERNFARLSIPEPPAPASASKPTANYRAAINEYLQNRALYDDFASIGTLASPKAKQLSAIDHLVGGTSADVFASRPEEIITYQNTRPALEALSVLGRVLIDRLALLNHREGNREAAEKYARAGAAMGAALCRERLCYDEFALGQELLSKSNAVLVPLVSPDEAAAWRAFDAQRLTFFDEQIEPMIRFVRSIDPNVVGTRTGDVFELAKRSQERMWRVEAILALGRVRYFVGTSKSAADQRAALAAVKKLADTDPDPVIRAAAAAARDLTAEQYRLQ